MQAKRQAKWALAALLVSVVLVCAGCSGNSPSRASASGSLPSDVSDTPASSVAASSSGESVSSAEAASSSASSSAATPIDVASLPAETVIPQTDLSTIDLDDCFTISPITDEVFARMDGTTFPSYCPVSRDDLRFLRLLHVDADGNTKVGEMVVNASIADDVLDIFRQLYHAGYPIERVRLAEDYGGDDEASMEANNSSAFNCRLIEGTSIISWHGYGLAVDINTLYNPYVMYSTGEVLPVTAGKYADRSVQTPYTINRGDLCYQLFTERGFEWGGDWDSPLDYQHFEKPM